MKKKGTLLIAIIILLALIPILSLILTKKPIHFADESKGNNSAPVIDNFPIPVKEIDDIDTAEITLHSRASGGYFYILSRDKWRCTYLKGVNIGLTLPHTDLNNPDIDYETYTEWFGMIKSMNANTIKIFTVMNPDFYRAFYDFNKTNCNDPLFLLQGFWIDENDMHEIGDAYGKNGKIIKNFKKTAHEVVDIINGKSSYTAYGDIFPAVYDKDISEYVVGYILGLEWSPDFILNTNAKNPQKDEYNGKYLFTRFASPFEAFLCEVGDYLIDYETETYNKQRPIAFLNWSSTDVITHTNEPFPEEDSAVLNTENIHFYPEYYAGLFAALDIYPYYPEFLNYQKEYIEYVDPSGKINPYRAYLKDLKSYYSVPVIIAEVGLPTSRGCAHYSVMDYNQGGIDEKSQGEYVAEMLADIAKEKYAGAMIFSWQDEWFKQTWNTVKYTPEKAKDRTFNPQSAEQSYGILSCQPGEEKPPCYTDDDISEWQGIPPAVETESFDVFLKADLGYLYVFLKGKTGFSFDKDKAVLAISTGGKGSKFAKEYNLEFDKPVDFLLLLNGKTHSRILTDAYCDAFYFEYHLQKKVFQTNMLIPKQNSGIFNKINTFVSNEIHLPVDNIVIPPQFYESGLLRFGNSNPKSTDYNSLSDFYYTDGYAEIRIPWYLLNVMNIAEKKVIGNFYKKNKISFEPMERFAVGCADLAADTKINITEYDIFSRLDKGYHTRLKKSFSVIKDAFFKIMEDY